MDKDRTVVGVDSAKNVFELGLSASGPRRPLGLMSREEGEDVRPAACVGALTREANEAQQGRRGSGEQAGANRMGGGNARRCIARRPSRPDEKTLTLPW